MRRVILESPYAANAKHSVEDHLHYAKKCMAHSLGLGEAPMVSHLLYTQTLDDADPSQRSLGINAGLAWGVVAEATVVYADWGVSAGMAEGIGRAKLDGRPIEYRFIETKEPLAYRFMD